MSRARRGRGLTINQSNGATVTATSTGPDTYGAQLPDGRGILAQHAEGLE